MQTTIDARPDVKISTNVKFTKEFAAVQSTPILMETLKQNPSEIAPIFLEVTLVIVNLVIVLMR